MKATSLIAEALVAGLLAGPVLAQVTPTDQKVPCRSYREVLALFDRLGYTQKAWQAGIREVPRVYLADVPIRGASGARMTFQSPTRRNSSSG